MLTREKVNELNDILSTAVDTIADYREKAYARTKDDDFVDRNIATAYGNSTLILAEKEGIREPHAIVGNSSSLVFLLRRLVNPEGYTPARIELINKNIDDIKVIFNYLLSSDKDKNILNSINDKFEEKVANSLDMIQKIQYIMLEEQKKIVEKEPRVAHPLSPTEKSTSAFFSSKSKKKEEEHKQITEKEEEEHKQITPPKSPINGPNKAQ